MLERAKRKQYVLGIHDRTITQISSGKKAGKWKTYVGNPRKEVLRSTESELFDYLFNYYQAQQHKDMTYKEVFEEFMEYKVNQLNRSKTSIVKYRNVFNRFVYPNIANAKIATITNEKLYTWLQEVVKATRPKPEAFRKLIQQIKSTFDYAVRKRYCSSNPTLDIDIHLYLKDCENVQKLDEEKEFSKAELATLWEDSLKLSSNPRSLMSMMASCTGMRAGDSLV